MWAAACQAPRCLASDIPPSSCCAQAAVEEGIVTGGGCTLLRLSHMVDAFKATLTDEEQKVRGGGGGVGCGA